MTEKTEIAVDEDLIRDRLHAFEEIRRDLAAPPAKLSFDEVFAAALGDGEGAAPETITVEMVHRIWLAKTRDPKHTRVEIDRESFLRAGIDPAEIERRIAKEHGFPSDARIAIAKDRETRLREYLLAADNLSKSQFERDAYVSTSEMTKWLKGEMGDTQRAARSIESKLSLGPPIPRKKRQWQGVIK